MWEFGRTPAFFNSGGPGSGLHITYDGGKTFDVIAGFQNNVHPDHHALWISPTDPSYLINGNDGGMNISQYGGDTWRFITNLPVGQFYHVNIDDDFPYNVYGGMQDNGTWVGPGFALKRGGITNADWQEVYFGDGFDSAPKANDNRYVYAMSQGGNLDLVDRETGLTRFIKPNHPDTTKLRYNWNAAFALEPGADCGIYYGNQFVHHSSDCGESWSIISPDLTTDYGSTWRRIVDDGDVGSFVTSVVQDHEEPNLLFLGTDTGLYISFNKGGKWTKWENGLPSVQIRDMKLQKSFDDLVFGTFLEGPFGYWMILGLSGNMQYQNIPINLSQQSQPLTAILPNFALTRVFDLSDRRNM